MTKPTAEGPEQAAKNIFPYKGQLGRAEREALHGHKAVALWFTGLPSSGKSTIGHTLEKMLADSGCSTYVFDGDNVRTGLCCDLGFSRDERRENLRRIAEMAKLFVDAGIIAIAAFISPLREDREMIRALVGPADFVEIFVDCPAEVCERRDPKGNYAKARSGQIPNFTGISAPYERPEDPDLALNSAELDPARAAGLVLELLRRRGVVA